MATFVPPNANTSPIVLSSNLQLSDTSNNATENMITVTTSGNITFNRTFTARVILVGGGGSGAQEGLENIYFSYWEGGGGGGGGGVGIGNITFTSNVSYSFTIGSGGNRIEYVILDRSRFGWSTYDFPRPFRNGNNGGNTSIIGGDINEVAYGGGGGGVYEGLNGGSGGGACAISQNRIGGSPTEGLSTKSNNSYVTYYGNMGGFSTGVFVGAGGGGGGGAGEMGFMNDYSFGGKGGDGKYVNLQNKNYCFGSGGGGSCAVKTDVYVRNGGQGGEGGGGEGVSIKYNRTWGNFELNYTKNNNIVTGGDAIDYTGGGGGGGGPFINYDPRSSYLYITAGGKGGHGVIIIIYPISILTTTTIINPIQLSSINNNRNSFSLSVIKNKNPTGFSKGLKFSNLVSFSSNILGLLPSFPAKNANDIIRFTGSRVDGPYYINCGDKTTNVSTLIYCLLDSKYDNGGWMMLMKATNSNTFSFDANYWTTTNVLNSNSVDRTDQDAKYDVYNKVNISDVLVLWPYVPGANNTIQYTGGSISTLTDAWSWLHKDFIPLSRKSTPIYGFAGIMKMDNTSNINNFGGWNSNVWSKQTNATTLTYSLKTPSGATYPCRMGFVFDDNADFSSPGASAGIGLPTISGGDYVVSGAVLTSTGVNKALRFELYGR